MRCNFYLRDPKTKGRTSIYLSVTYRGQRCIFYPGESIDKDDWDNKKFKPKPIAGNNALIGRLNRFEQLVRDTHDDLQKSFNSMVSKELLTKAVNELIRPALRQEKVTFKPLLVTEFFQMLIDDSLSGKRRTNDDLDLNPNSVKPYKSALNHFIDFETKQKQQYYLSGITQQLVKAFADYLNSKLAINASAKYLTVLKLLLTYATEKKLADFNHIKVVVKKEKSDSIYLTEQEIKDLMAIKEFPTDLYEVVRDYFVIGCNTGLRFSDYSRLRIENIKDGFIEIDPAKTKNKIRTNTKVIIPVHQLVRQILVKYPAGFPACPPNQVFNRYLKEIGKMVPSLGQEFEKKMTRSHKVESTIYNRWALLTTHTCRRSFCTNMYLKGVPVITIMAISGHKTQENFMKYIKAEGRMHADILKKKFDEDENTEGEGVSERLPAKLPAHTS